MNDQSQELLDLVDAKGTIIGTATRAQCHGNPSLRHQTVHVIVTSQDGKILLQKRALDKDVQPGKWDTAVGGHVAHGETPELAAIREYQEEIGHHPVAPLRHLFQMNIHNDFESEITQVYITRDNGPFQPQLEELSQLKFWTVDEIRQAMGHALLTPYLEHEINLLFNSNALE